MITFREEPLTEDLLAEALPLLAAHWQEIAHYDDIPLAVDTHTYLASAEAGVVRCFTAREQTCRPELVGYALFFVRPALHYHGSLQAVQDVIYLAPEVRGGTGAQFIQWIDTHLAAMGVQVVMQHAKLAHPQLGKALERLGYEPVETMYAKRLDTLVAMADAALVAYDAGDTILLCGGHTPVAPARPRAQHAGAAWPSSEAAESPTDLLDFSESMQALAGAHD